MHLGGLAYLAHVSSHTGLIGSERASVFVKEGISLDIIKTQLPIPKSFMKKFQNQKY